MVAQLEPNAHRVLKFDPEGHRMGPIGTLAAQAGLIWGLLWVMGVIRDLLLPPAAGVFCLLLALGSVMLAPRRVVMEYPISISLTAMYAITVASITWTVDSAATMANINGLIPAMLGIVIIAGLLTLQDLINAIIWTIRLTLVITVAALIAMPSTRVHVGVQSGGVEDYAGWHGLFNHKNNMSEFLVLAIPTVLVFHRNNIVKWGTLGVIAVLLVGSTSATGVSAAFFAVVAWVWLELYRRRADQDTRDSTLLFLVSVLGSAAIIAVAATSIATVTSAYGKDTTFSGRTQIWEATLDAISREPWLGHGFGALFWSVRTSPRTAEIWRQVGFENTHAHNGILDLILQIGILGAVVFTILWASTFYKAWQAISSQPDLGVWVVVVLSSNLLMSLSENTFYGGWLAIFGILKVLLMRRDESLRRPGWLEQPIDKWAFR